MKLKTYLNQDEREIATYYVIVYGLIVATLDDPSKVNNMSSEEVTYLKYIRTYFEKYILALTKRVGIKEGDRIYKKAQSCRVTLVPRGTDDGQLVVNKDSLEEVCRMAVETHCFGCKRTDYHNCHLRDCMDKMGVGSITDNAGKCEFLYEEG